MNKTVLVLGGSGLLGQQVVRELLNSNFPVIWSSTDGMAKKWLQVDKQASCLHFPFHLVESAVEEAFSHLQCALETFKPYVVVNCLRGVSHQLWPINAGLPLFLEQMGQRVIHVSTNAVFSCSTEIWSHYDRECPQTEYGFSKLAGERADTQLVLRTSFVGFNSQPGLCQHWLRPEQQDRLWNGVTTKCLAKVIVDEVLAGANPGIKHVCSEPMKWSSVVKLMIKRYNLPVETFSKIKWKKGTPLLLSGYMPEPSLKRQVQELTQERLST